MTRNRNIPIYAKSSVISSCARASIIIICIIGPSSNIWEVRNYKSRYLTGERFRRELIGVNKAIAIRSGQIGFDIKRQRARPSWKLYRSLQDFGWITPVQSEILIHPSFPQCNPSTFLHRWLPTKQILGLHRFSLRQPSLSPPRLPCKRHDRPFPLFE